MLTVTWGPLAAKADPSSASVAVDFAHEVRPILSRHCFACHGPDPAHRKAGFRIDIKEGAFATLDEGKGAIVPGKPEASEVFARITHADVDERMPPKETGKALSTSEVQTLRRWIAEGAPWSGHWSFEPIKRPSPPHPVNPELIRNPIDNFVQASARSVGLTPAPQAAPAVLLRRLSLDLVGLLPAQSDVDDFVAHPSDANYRRYVDRYLNSAAYGERWARVWLDLARYADTKGFEKDQVRTIWRYRDWLISALNQDMPFDRFSTEQLAGDLLPNATQDQILATAFHRNTMTNDEGGTDDEEFRVAAVKDRVDVTMQVWMGLTAGCAKCHDHKYDPITQVDYYRLFAFFNQTQDADRWDDAPLAAMPTNPQRAQLAKLQADELSLKRKLVAQAKQTPDFLAWRTRLRRTLSRDYAATAAAGLLRPIVRGSWHRTGPYARKGERAFDVAFEPQNAPFDPKRVFDGGQTRWNERAAWKDGAEVRFGDDRAEVVWYAGRTFEVSSRRRVAFSVRTGVALAVWIDGVLQPRTDPVAFEFDGEWLPGVHSIVLKLADNDAKETFVFDWRADDVGTEPVQVAARLLAPQQDGTDESDVAARFFSVFDPEGSDERRPDVPFVNARATLQKLRRIRAEREAADAAVARIPILKDLTAPARRKTFLHARGDFLSPGAEVQPGTPSAFFPSRGEGNRLTLARWLFDPRNPLTARVAVNRMWAQMFGRGLVETEEDFGAQGTPASHPMLLDWLASEFVRQRWSPKALCRTIVLSHTYRQASEASRQGIERDRYNVWLTRGPRFRMEGEMVRDNALLVAGLLSPKIGGPSVMPMQPEGIWRSVYSGVKWETSPGEDRHRRSLYTFVKRTSPYPSMTTFDAPSREVCTIRRFRSNTPLQALVTLNDPVFTEAAQGLARCMLTLNLGVSQRVAQGFEWTTARAPLPDELNTLVALFRRRLAYFRKHQKEAASAATQPLGALPPGEDAAELAAYTVVGSVLLNLDEFLTKG
ncbi:MAG: PSD1 and planctomycete cytochrome C domain-containing protein [Deltaproteobacteria bacterium]|nr:PSD1 and planctomycete cytochrome C domain-containing protein [Deltaproteobacteria bacterium]